MGLFVFRQLSTVKRVKGFWLGCGAVICGSHLIVQLLHDLGNLLLQFHFTREAVVHAGLLFGGGVTLAKSGTGHAVFGARFSQVEH